MAPKHKNPTRKNRTAVAPYNFVSLPDDIIVAELPPDHNKYINYSGHFLVRLTTQSPTFVRDLLTFEEFRHQEEERDIDGKKTTKMTNSKKEKVETPFRKLVKNKPEFFNYFGETKPVIPGSSLRGMLRLLYEIVTYSKMQSVSDALRIHFRAVADKNDPLQKPYKDIIGNNAQKVHVGYLEHDEDSWFVKPAKTPKQIDSYLSNDRYIKVRKDAIKNGSVSILINNFLGLDEPGYAPQYYNVSFSVGRIWYNNKEGERKEPYSAKIISLNDKQLSYRGTLVTTGNMLETSDGAIVSPRMNIYLIPEVSDNDRIRLSEQAVEDYLSALTPFQKSSPFDSNDGVLQEGRPIFYVPPKHNESEIFYFGHTPNFRIPFVNGTGLNKRAVTPYDFIPDALKSENNIDFTEAVFGFIRSDNYRQQTGFKQGNKRAGYSSRVFMTDANLVSKQKDIFFVQEGDNTVTPKILTSPKPTAFQLYLIQLDSDKKKLKHYGSNSPNETAVRGFKLYWHKGDLNKKDLEPNPTDPGMENGKVKENSTQHTQMKPLRSGLTFEFKIFFNNLTDVELGALAWILSLPDNHCHKIGMGKSLGMGSILLHDIELYIEDIGTRYRSLFEDATWKSSTNPDLSDYKAKFEEFMLVQLQIEDRSMNFQSLPRIKELLSLLSWWKHESDWISSTSYMNIKNDSNQVDDYSERTVLPNPEGVIENAPPQLGDVNRPTSQQFERKAGKQLKGTVKYFGKRSGGIMPDTEVGIVRVNRRELPANINKLEVGQRIRFIAVEENGELRAYEIELIDDE